MSREPEELASKEIARELRRCRRVLGLPLARVAELTGLSGMTVWRAEHGRMSLTTLDRLSSFYVLSWQRRDRNHPPRRNAR